MSFYNSIGETLVWFNSCFVLINEKKRKEKDGPMQRWRCYTEVLQDANRSLAEADHR
jgi:hypothetical protein